jgi:hypothetical protein
MLSQKQQLENKLHFYQDAHAFACHQIAYCLKAGKFSQEEINCWLQSFGKFQERRVELTFQKVRESLKFEGTMK